MTYHRDKDPTERMFERLSKNPNVELGLHRLQENPNTDPALRSMATAVLQECEQGRRRIEGRKMGNVVGGVFVVIFFIILFIFLIVRGRQNH